MKVKFTTTHGNIELEEVPEAMVGLVLIAVVFICAFQAYFSYKARVTGRPMEDSD